MDSEVGISSGPMRAEASKEEIEEEEADLEQT